MASDHNPQSYAAVVSSGGPAQGQQQGTLLKLSYYQFVNQVTALINQFQTMQNAPSPLPPIIQVISDKIKMPTSDKYDGQMDGGMVQELIQMVDNYFNLVPLTNPNLYGDIVPDNIALHLFDQGLQSNIVLQVFNVHVADLAAAQQVAQSAPLAFGMAGTMQKPGKTVPLKKEKGSQYTSCSDGGHKEMDLGSAARKKPKSWVTCYNCGEKGYYANECTKLRQEKGKAKNDNAQEKPKVDRLMALEAQVPSLVFVVTTLENNE